MNDLSIIVPSRNASNLSACVAAIWRNEPARLGFRIIVIDDSPDFGLPCDFHPGERIGGHPRSVSSYIGTKPFIFARNINRGIEIAGRDDVIILNDDALLETPGGFYRLQSIADLNRRYGVVAPVIPDCGNAAQRPLLDAIYRDREDLKAAVLSGDLPYPEAPPLRSVRMVVFACAFVPRRVIDQVGLLDESFGINAGGLADPDGPQGYGCEDNDYCRRVRARGLKVGVYESVRVTHGGALPGALPPTFRINHDAERYAADSVVHERLYESKWGEKP